MFNILHNAYVGKEVSIGEIALEEFKELPLAVQEEFTLLVGELERYGRLEEPEAKKIVGTRLFELRVKCLGEWRCLYAYVGSSGIILLRFFIKKSQKTPRRELEIAKKRLWQYT